MFAGLSPVVVVVSQLLCFSATATFDSSSCGTAKGCYMPSKGLAFSYKVLSEDLIDVELTSEANSSNSFVAPSIECSSIGDQPPTISIPDLNSTAERLRMPNEMASRERYFTDVVTSLQNGTLYCRARLHVTGQKNPNVFLKMFSFQFFTYVPSEEYTLTLSSGTIKGGTRYTREIHTSPATTLADQGQTPTSQGLDVTTRRRLNKAHAILMVLSWLFFVPTGVLFARFLRESWSGSKPGGLTIWFHVHRTCNIIAIVMMIASFICIMISKGWKWTGPGSTSKYYTKVHTLTGLIALILAWLQPFVTLLRNFTFSATCLAVAALEFKIWPDHDLQLVLVLSPTLVIIGLAMLFFFIDVAIDVDDANYSSIQSIRLSLVFWAIGVLMAVCVWMTVLLANGYKNAILECTGTDMNVRRTSHESRTLGKWSRY
ncbi:unnamed protein product [Nippostrongylus brasiliensis]|uniref:ascorbate ferrireductase (transmembrane) n=1 Tax=Nippostrongylus brasiliensis TaxID=27835 RepID=A0A0N4XY56_NIPBR|nr:unnamed protein product [Nippostrongylus brasiliensis]